ncbi:MAG: YdcF family protein [Ilumatobacteraceae bacterium]
MPIVSRPPPPRRGPWLRRIAWAVVLACIAFGAYYAISVFQVWQTGRSDEARPVDAIVVMGAAQYDGTPSPQLQARLDHVLQLWPQGLAPVVVVTGGKQPLDRFTEADASAQYLIDNGVPPEAILRETEGQNSYDSLAGVQRLLADVGLSRVLLVSDPFHSLRIRLTAEELGMEAFVSPTRTSPVQGRAAFVRELKEAAGVALGRVVSFRRLLEITG